VEVHRSPRTASAQLLAARALIIDFETKTIWNKYAFDVGQMDADALDVRAHTALFRSERTPRVAKKCGGTRCLAIVTLGAIIVSASQRRCYRNAALILINATLCCRNTTPSRCPPRPLRGCSRRHSSSAMTRPPANGRKIRQTSRAIKKKYRRAFARHIY